MTEDFVFEYTKMKRDKVIELLREQGCRITKQRLLLLDIILSEECSCCKEIFYEATKQDKGIGQSTVYRMVGLLEEIGAINRKNMYKISYEGECERKEIYEIMLDDKTVCVLNPEQWKEILRAGLQKYGYIKKQKIQSIHVIPMKCDEKEK